MVRRGGWALADQAVSSLTNFALSVAVARAVGVREFGAFGLAVGLYLFLVGLSRALVSEPLLVRFSSGSPQARSAAVAQSTGTAVALGVAFGAVTSAAAGLVPGPVGEAMLPLGVSLPGLLLQDAWRFAFLAQGRPARAAANDAVWAVAQTVAMGVVLVGGGGSVGLLVAAWGLSAAVAGVAGGVQSRIRPSPRAAPGWLARHGDLASRFAGEFVVRQGGRQLTIYAVGAAGGLTALAAIRGAQVVFGPLHVLLASVQLMAVPEAVRLASRSLPALAGAVRTSAFALAAVGLAAGGASLLLPDGVGEALLGESWRGARPVLLPQAAVMAAIGASTAYLTGLRALGAARRSFRTRLVTLPALVAGGAAGAVLHGPAGAIGGIAVAQAAAALVFAREFARAVNEAGAVASAPASPTPRRPSLGRSR